MIWHHLQVIQCVRVMGVWSILLAGGLVSTETTRSLGWYSHHSERAAPHSDRGGPLGGQVARQDDQILVR